MGKVRKESRHFYISVEGTNCERMYFNHVAMLINTSDANTYHAKITCKKVSPEQFAKRIAHLPVDKSKNKKIPYFHVQDIEDYYNEAQRKKFFRLIDEMRRTEKDYHISYQLGYTNFTFELWMLLHVSDMKAAVANRTSYLKPINQNFHRQYQSLDEFKSEKEFAEILKEFVTLDSIKAALKRADAIVQSNLKHQKPFENYNGFRFYHDNPDLTLHEIIKLIFYICGVKF